MSTKHLFPADGLVQKALRGVLASNPSLALIESARVVYDTAHPKANVALISGGGSGHEPAFAGYVGSGMLAAAVAGDIFASPTTAQILTAIEAVPTTAGTLLVVLNYTGDCLNFGLAAERANATRKNSCAVVIVGDDVSVPGGGGLVGRRGLAAQVVVIKILGAAAAQGASLVELEALGKAVAAQCVSIAATLDHCHKPSQGEHDQIPDGEIEIGTGPHNETGYSKLNPAPSTPDLVATMLKYLLDANDKDRGYIKCTGSDDLALLINNFGGLSPLELCALADEFLVQLQQTWSIVPKRVYTGSILTSLNAPAFSVSIVNLTAADNFHSSSNKKGLAPVLQLLDAPTAAGWAAVAGNQVTSHRKPHTEQVVSQKTATPAPIDPATDIHVSSPLLHKALQTACNALIAAEPDLTAWDTVMGDGDCGTTLERGASALLEALDTGLAEAGSVGGVLREVETIVESRMGGTLGGILGIFFVKLRAELSTLVEAEGKAAAADQSILWGKAMQASLAHLGNYTPAQPGDRTVMDVLVPVAQTLADGKGLKAASEVAAERANGTRGMRPRLGRATYVEEKGEDQLPPDPGAWGIMVAVRGLYEGLNE